jgi:hypothetical protein
VKIEEVPQDLKYCKDAVVRDQTYAVDSEGKYHMVKSDGWTPKNDALDLALEEDKDKEVRAQMTMNATTDFHGFELPLSHQPAAHCENGAISTLLRYYGIELSEPMVFGLASGLFFTHLPFIKMSGMPVTAFRTFPGVLFKRITSLLGIQTETHRYLSKEKAMRQLDQVILEQKKPVGCVVGMFNLPYLPVEYRFHFNGHNICITGKDEKTGDYCVLDSNATQKVTISREDLLKVRFATGGTYPLLGQMYWIKSVPEQLPDLRPLILKSIRKTCWNMVSQPDFIHIAGANGILYLSRRIRTWESKMGARRAKQNLAQVIRMLEEIGTGGAGFRFIYGAFLQEAAEKTGISEFNDCSARITDIGDLWREFAYKASRIVKHRAGENYTYDELGDILKTIGEKEKVFFTELDHLSKSFLK